MTMPTKTWKLDPEELLRHEEWLRALLRGLLGDGQQVDDVLQKTWMTALRRPPQTAGALRGWLGSVARRFALREHRDGRRRRGHERVAAREEQVPSTEETVAKLAAQRFVTKCVSDLAEPYRTAVLLRYHDGLRTREIAARTEATEANVRQRIKRGMDEVRAKCEAKYGRDWRASRVLLALAVPNRATVVGASSVVGVLLMSKTLRFAAAAIVLIGLGVWLPVAFDSSEAATPPVDPEVVSDAGLAGDEGTDDEVAARDVVSKADEPSSIPAVMDPETWAVSGRVLDEEGQPLPGVPVGCWRYAEFELPAGVSPQELGVTVPAAKDMPEPERTFKVLGHSDDLGEFGFEMPAEEGELESGDGYYTYRSANLNDRSKKDGLILVAAQCQNAQGVVVDETGAPVPGADVRGSYADLSRFPEPLDFAVQRYGPSVHADAEGRFVLEDVPVQRGRLYASAEGFATAWLRAPLENAADLRIVLQRRDPNRYVVTGRVTDPFGAPLTEAHVRLDDIEVATDANGEFRLGADLMDGWHWGSDLLFYSPGLQARVEREFGRRLQKEKSVHLEVRLVGTSLMIEGRVLRSDGTPWSGVAVYPWNLESFGMNSRTLESLSLPAKHREKIPGFVSVDTSAVTDDDGRFVLPGLLDREYELRVFDRKSYFGWVAEPVFAGRKDVELRVPADAFVDRIRGVAVSVDGEPLADVQVDLGGMVTKTSSGSTSRSSEVARTDENGVFELERTARYGAELSFKSPETVPAEMSIIDVDDGEFEITLYRRCPFRVEFGTPMRGHIHVLDAEGERMTLYRFNATGNSAFQQLWFDEKGTGVVTAGENAATVVLLGNDQKEISRSAVRLRPDEVTVVRF